MISESIGFGLAFVLGVLTSVHCVAMCGGFVMHYSTARAATQRRSWKLHAWYASGKLLSYGIIGAAFGLLGKSVAIAPGVRVATAIAAGVLLVVYGLISVGILPLQHLPAVRLPAGLLTRLSALKHRYNHPLLFGLFSGLMLVCGPLQAMYVAAAGTGSVIQGAVLLVLFGAGTLPMLAGVGVAAGFFSYRFSTRVLRVSGLVVILLGALMINRGVAMSRGDAGCHDPLQPVSSASPTDH